MGGPLAHWPVSGPCAAAAGPSAPRGPSGGAGAQARWGGCGPVLVMDGEPGNGIAPTSLNYLSENALLVWP